MGAEMDLGKASLTPYIVVWIWLLLDTRSAQKQLNTLFWKIPTFSKRIPICPHLRSLVKLQWEGEIKEVLCPIHGHMTEL